MELTRDRAGQPWRARHREILSRIVRETEPPTDSLPRMTSPGRTEHDDAYYARVGEVLDLAGSIGAILMASGHAGDRHDGPGDGHRRRVRHRALRGRRHQHDDPRRCLPRAHVAGGHHAAHRAIPVDGLQPTGGRRPSDRSYPRGSGDPRRTLATSSTPSSPRRTPTSAGSPPWPGARWRSLRREPWAPICWPAWSAR